MSRFLRLNLVFVLFLCFSSTVFSKTVKRKKKSNAQLAVIVSDGAAVYSKASFDSAVLDYLNRGKVYRISKRSYPGAGGLGIFYKIKLKNKKIGYIVDTDVETRSRGLLRSSQEERSDDTDRSGQVIYFKKFLGVGVFTQNYQDVYEGVSFTSPVTSVALKATGPDVLFNSPPMDFELAINTNVPDYFTSFSHQTSGFIINGSLAILAPLRAYSNSLLYYSYGLMGVYENFNVEAIAGTSVNSQDLRMGVRLGLGFAYYMGSYVFRFEGNYNYEQNKALALGIYIQKPY